MQQQRHLAAILFTDIVGYTAIMQKNEAQAVALVKRYLAVLRSTIETHAGQILNDYGDGSLCIFHSATQAVQAALELQEELKKRPIVPLRIGLHIGEIFFEDGKVFGDGVNVASRIQSLGQANTILFSGEINNKIRNHPEFSSASLGQFEFKNVAEPVEVFALSNPGLIVPKKEQMTGKLKDERKKIPAKKLLLAGTIVLLIMAALFVYNKFNQPSQFTGTEKSIAVLPFINMSTNKENEFFSDGMTEEIITQLSKIADLKVIGRTSSMLYKGSNKSIKQIAEELDVYALLEGSVQRDGDKIRITAKLVDANTQKQIWAQPFDRNFKDVFAIQSEVAQAIADRLRANLTKDEKKKIEKAPTNNTEAYQYYLQGHQLSTSFWETMDTEYFENSIAMFKKAIEIDPNYAVAHAGLADHYNTYFNYIKEDSQFIFLQNKEIERAWEIDSTNDYVIGVRGILETNTEKSFYYLKKSVEINPNNTTSLWNLGVLMRNPLGLLEEAKLLFDRAIRLDPLVANYFSNRGLCNYFLNNLEEAVKDFETALRLRPKKFEAMDWLALVYASLGRLDDAKKIEEKSLQLEPDIEKHDQFALATVYAKLGIRQKALQLKPKDWMVLLSLGRNEEAIKAILDEHTENRGLYYLFFKSHLNNEFNAIKNNPDFLKALERSRIQYEQNKNKFSIAEILN